MVSIHTIKYPFKDNNEYLLGELVSHTETLEDGARKNCSMQSEERMGIEAALWSIDQHMLNDDDFQSAFNSNDHKISSLTTLCRIITVLRLMYLPNSLILQRKMGSRNLVAYADNSL